MSTLSLLIPLLIATANHAVAQNVVPEQQDGRRQQLLELICTDQQASNELAKSGQQLSKEKLDELAQLKEYFPRWFGHEFNFDKDCPSEFKGIM